MKIGAKIDRMIQKGNVKAIASVSLDGMFVVKGLKVKDGRKGLFVSMPQESYPGKDGQKQYSIPIGNRNKDEELVAKMKYSDVALFTDLDGTLFNSRREVSVQNIEAIERFIKSGGSFGISTGRAPQNAKNMLPGLNINSWSVVVNGAEAYHFSCQKATAQRCLPKEQMETLIRWVLKELPEVNIQLCTDDQLLFLSQPEFADWDFVSTHQPMSEMSVDEALRFPWLKVLFCAPRRMLTRLHGYAMENGMTAVMDSVYTNEVYLEFLPSHTNKGSCLKKLRGQPELMEKTFIAIGDYTNDIELLQEADIAVAVENALDEVKSIADYIVCTNDDHALAHLIDLVIPQI